MYAVVAHFNKKTELAIKKVWSDLSDNSISEYAKEIPNRRPHITIASYDKLDLEEYIPLFDEYYKSKSSLSLTLNVLGTFLNSGALFLSPTPSLELLNFHNQHHLNFEAYNDNPNSLYLPDNWIPHCTIANRLSHDKLEEAFIFCTQSLETLHAFIDEIAIINIIYEKNSCNSAPIIHTISLN